MLLLELLTNCIAMELVVMSDTWQERRAAFNHDWLKNEYLKAVDAFISRLGHHTPDTERIREFLAEDFPSWEYQRRRLQMILDTIENELSPRVLFSIPPLSRCSPETMEWLPNLTHELWLQRTSISKKVQDTEAAMNRSDSIFKTITGEVEKLFKKAGQTDLKNARLIFSEFSKSLRDLSDAISAFPHGIKVV